jgi:YD repeat-containing protein
MKNLFCLILLTLFFKADAQYYYKDLIAASEITQLKKTYTDNNIKKVRSTGFTPNGDAYADYNETQDHDALNRQLKITTNADQDITSLIYKFDDAGRIESVTDSSAPAKSVSNYKYDQSGRLVEINNTMTDSLQTYTQTEKHVWNYSNDKPEKMWRIINKTDSMEVRFIRDEKGNIIEEQNFKKARMVDQVYYYYDDKNRLTDIVRYNTKAKKLLPDFMFEYDDNNRVIQKITTTSNQNIGYLIWRYLYNEKGLKTKEALYNKEKKLMGRIDFFYN